MHFIYTPPNILMPFLKNILTEIHKHLKQNNLINDYFLVIRSSFKKSNLNLTIIIYMKNILERNTWGESHNNYN